MTDASSTAQRPVGDRTPPRVLFFCGERSPWGRAHLEPLLEESRVELAGVVLATEARWAVFREKLTGEPASLPGPLGRARQYVGRKLGRREDHAAGVRRLLAGTGVPLIFSDSVNRAADRRRFRQAGADLFFSAAYPQIFGRLLLGLPPRGAFNSHPSLLPRCRGAHPVFWAIASGELKSGGTIHLMTSELDRGGIAVQQEVPLGDDDYHADLYARLEGAVPGLLRRFVDWLLRPGAELVDQDEARATFFTNDRREDHRIDWSEMDAAQINRLVRACGGKAFFTMDGREILVRRVSAPRAGRGQPGTVTALDGGRPVVAAREGMVTIEACETGDGGDVSLAEGDRLADGGEGPR